MGDLAERRRRSAPGELPAVLGAMAAGKAILTRALCTAIGPAARLIETEVTRGRPR
jgi:ABC-type hemin transport system ATPase subunit